MAIDVFDIDEIGAQYIYRPASQLQTGHHYPWVLCNHFPLVNMCERVSVCGQTQRGGKLTLSKLRLRNSLPNDAAGIVHHGGGLKLHGLDHIAHTDL